MRMVVAAVISRICGGASRCLPPWRIVLHSARVCVCLYVRAHICACVLVRAFFCVLLFMYAYLFVMCVRVCVCARVSVARYLA